MTNPTWAGRSASPPTPEGESQRAGWIPVVGVVAALGLVGAGGYLLGSSDDAIETAASPTTTVVDVATTDEAETAEDPVVDTTDDDLVAQTVEDSAATDSAATDSTSNNTASDDTASDDSAPAADADPAEDSSAEDDAPDAADDRADADAAEGEQTANQVAIDEGQVRGALLRDGVLYLGGAVPSEEVGNQIIERAEAVVGEGNVVSEYVIDPEVEMDQGAPLYIDDVVLFAYGANTYDPQFEPLLDLGLALLSQNPSVTVTIITHTDASGSASFNDHLSYQRGESVAQYWVDRGIPVEQIRIDARGEREPIADDHTDEGAQLNRRAEFFIEGLLP